MKFSVDVKGWPRYLIKCRRNIAEILNRLSRRTNVTDDRRAIAYSEREREFTFDKMVDVH